MALSRFRYTVVTLWSRLLKEFYGYEGKFVIENDRETDKAYRGMCGL